MPQVLPTQNSPGTRNSLGWTFAVNSSFCETIRAPCGGEKELRFLWKREQLFLQIQHTAARREAAPIKISADVPRQGLSESFRSAEREAGSLSALDAIKNVWTLLIGSTAVQTSVYVAGEKKSSAMRAAAFCRERENGGSTIRRCCMPRTKRVFLWCFYRPGLFSAQGHADTTLTADLLGFLSEVSKRQSLNFWVVPVLFF